MQLHFESSGHGPALIILHGLCGSLENWRSMTRRLSEDFTVFAVDARNHGKSPHSQEMTYPLMAADVLEFMTQHRLDRANLLGHSMGGKTAMQFALSYPERLDRLIVADIAPKAYPSREKQMVEVLLAIDIPQFQSRHDLEVVLADGIPDLAMRRFLLKDLKKGADGRFHWQMNLPAILENYDVLTEAVVSKGVFDKPTLFVRGEKSRYIKPEDVQPIQTLFPQAVIRTLEGAGHWLHVETPEAFFRSVREFLAAKTSG
jgi:esterase